jgi:hypothetical protein
VPPFGFVAGTIEAVDRTRRDGAIELWLASVSRTRTRVLVGPLVGTPGLLVPRVRTGTPVAVSYRRVGATLRIRAVQVLR